MALTKATNRMIEGASVNVKDFGAVGDGVTDDTVAIQAATAFKDVHFPEGTYIITAKININHDIRITGHNATIQGNTSSDAYFYIYGSIESELAVSAVGVDSVTVTSSYDVGDLFIIRDDRDYSFSRHRDYYKKGEALTVESNTGSVITTEETLSASYTDFTNLKTVKINPVKVKIEGVTFTSTVATYALRLKYVKDSAITDCKVLGGLNSALSLAQSYNTAVTRSSLEHRGANIGYNYGISIADSHYTRVSECSLFGTRHATGLGGANEATSVPCFHTVIENCSLNNNYTQYVADIHGNCRDTFYIRNEINGGIAISGENCVYQYNKITSHIDRPSVDLVEIVGGDFKIYDNSIEVHKDPASTITQVINSSSSSFGADWGYDFLLDIRRNTFSLNSNFTRVLSLYATAGGTAAVDINYIDNTYRNDCSGLVDIVGYYNLTALTPKKITILGKPEHTTMPSTVNIFTLAYGSISGCELTLPTYGFQKTVSFASGDWRSIVYDAFPFDFGTYEPPILHSVTSSSAIAGARYVFSVAGYNTSSNGVNVGATTGSLSETVGAAIDVDVYYSVGGTISIP
jgi:hypothetical protein